MLRVRPAAVAGSFYPGRPEALSAEVDRLLSSASPPPVSGRLRALIVPHAGYVYSGPIAATAYALPRSLRGSVRRVVLLGPSHFVPLFGLALPDADAFQTPLGQVPLDREAMDRIAALPQVSTHAAAHAREHSLEVQLAFVQRVLGEVPLVPLAVGRTRPDEVARVIDALASDDSLVLVSSDLSHYLPYMRARDVDRDTAVRIVALEPVGSADACGAWPVNGLLAWARGRGLRVTLLDLRNSGDTAGGRDQVVGYGAFAFTEARA